MFRAAGFSTLRLELLTTAALSLWIIVATTSDQTMATTGTKVQATRDCVKSVKLIGPQVMVDKRDLIIEISQLN